ncbi:MAG: DUF5320 domain-containing protein [Candidatus Thorarchaeota archaeon]|nr:MAG: hypothetical protein DRP09_15600 [Candidatus Thorarchaeota archaeon]RLI60210.1 MAG: hypothetical protein DRO87_00760 [Candidatus Thorarchaeota archaeon]
MRRGYGRSGGRGMWPGNGPFSNLPPWERPGWLYGRGSCWYLGYGPRYAGTSGYAGFVPTGANESQVLKQQRDLLENQLKNLQESLARIEARLKELESQ